MSYCEKHGTVRTPPCGMCVNEMKGGEGYGRQDGQKERGQEKVLTAAQVQTLRDLHRKVKGSYLQLTQLLDELDLLMRTV